MHAHVRINFHILLNVYANNFPFHLEPNVYSKSKIINLNSCHQIICIIMQILILVILDYNKLPR